MRLAKKYDKNYLEKIVKESKSFREMGKKLGVDPQTAKSAVLRYNILYIHFKHGKSYDELIGKKFGKLTVSSIYKKNREGKRSLYRAKCLCDCGNEKDADASSLKAKRTGKCGNCIKKTYKKRYKKITGKKNKNFTGYEEIRGRFWTQLKAKTKKRKIVFNLDIKDVWELYLKQDRKCALSDVIIKFGRTDHRTETTASLDRIDSNIGYVEGNVQWVHKSLNIMKNDLPNNIFIGLCCQVNKRCGDQGVKDIKKLSENHFIKRGDKRRKNPDK